MNDRCAFVFFCSPVSDFITGQILYVDGGYNGESVIPSFLNYFLPKICHRKSTTLNLLISVIL
jgi:hypothetical protein